MCPITVMGQCDRAHRSQPVSAPSLSCSPLLSVHSSTLASLPFPGILKLPHLIRVLEDLFSEMQQWPWFPDHLSVPRVVLREFKGLTSAVRPRLSIWALIQTGPSGQSSFPKIVLNRSSGCLMPSLHSWTVPEYPNERCVSQDLLTCSRRVLSDPGLHELLCWGSLALLKVSQACFKFKNSYLWTWYGSLVTKVLALHEPGSHLGISSNLACSTFHSTCCLWSGKMVEDGQKPWDLATAWETQKMLLASGFRSEQLQPLQMFKDWTSRQEIFLSVSPSLCISALPIKINKSFKKISYLSPWAIWQTNISAV